MIIRKYIVEIAEILLNHKLKCAVAESCTGGLLGGSFTSVSGSSKWFSGGIIAYSNSVKIDILGIDSFLIEKFGAVSEEVAKEMAYKCASIFNSELTISITGIAGPNGGSILKPVGLVWIGVLFKEKFSSLKVSLSGDRRTIRENSVNLALEFVFQTIDNTTTLEI